MKRNVRHDRIRWVACVEAGLVYASSAFVIGFALGAIRFMLIAPRVGETVAVLLEAPFMLAVSWGLSNWSAKRFGILSNVNDTLMMGAIAFAVLNCAELGTAMVVLKKTVQSYFTGLATVSGGIGVMAQVCFAIFPLLCARRYAALTRRSSSRAA